MEKTRNRCRLHRVNASARSSTPASPARSNDCQAHAAWDSTWGTNAVATRKNNLFGYGVTPSCPFDCAVPFESQVDSIDFVTELVKDDYLTIGGRFYNRPNLAGMEPIYSGDANWAEGIAAIMNLLRENTPCP